VIRSYGEFVVGLEWEEKRLRERVEKGGGNGWGGRNNRKREHILIH
jgi:hypothetical protein